MIKQTTYMRLIFLLLGGFISLGATGMAPPEGEASGEPDSIPIGRPYIMQEQRVEWLLEAHRARMAAMRGIPGFRVQIYMASGNQARLLTLQQMELFEEGFPGVPAYMVYEEPNFKLRVGDFRNRLDARRFLESIKRQYPAAYIVMDQIRFPALEEGNP